MSKGLVSVIIPTYGRPTKLQRAVNSVLAQTYPNIEIVVVDDNDPDTVSRNETELVMDGYSNSSKVKYVKHPYNKNGSAARNTGFKNSQGDYIAFLDDDDEYLQNKVSSQVDCLTGLDHSWGACYTKYKRLRNGKLDTISAETREGDLYFQALCRNLFIQAGSNLMVRREVFEDINGFDETFRRNQDLEFLVRLLRKYKLAYVDEMGLIYHRHPSNEKRSFDMEKITAHYTNSFSSNIAELSEKEKEYFDTMINLQLFRYRLVGRKDMKKAFSMVVDGCVGYIDVIRYLSHLFYRRISKKSCGFDL